MCYVPPLSPLAVDASVNAGREGCHQAEEGVLPNLSLTSLQMFAVSDSSLRLQSHSGGALINTVC